MIKDDTQNNYIQSVNRVIDLINLHFSEELTLERLAGVACFSPFHFHKIFKAVVGETHQKYINRIRLERAVQLMDEGMSLTGVAMAVGFSTPSHFSDAFKKLYKISPRKYREKRKLKKHKISKVSPTDTVYIADNDKGFGKLRLHEFSDYTVAYVRHIGDYNFRIGLAWQKLMRWAAQNKLITPDSIRISCSYDDPELTPEGKLRYDACITIPEGVKAEGPVGVRKIRGGLFVLFNFQGRTSGLSGFYDRVYSRLLTESSISLRNAPGYRVHLEGRWDQVRGKLSNELRIPVTRN
jgi:AraC family transcriptional regulator